MCILLIVSVAVIKYGKCILIKDCTEVFTIFQQLGDPLVSVIHPEISEKYELQLSYSCAHYIAVKQKMWIVDWLWGFIFIAMQMKLYLLGFRLFDSNAKR